MRDRILRAGTRGQWQGAWRRGSDSREASGKRKRSVRLGARETLRRGRAPVVSAAKGALGGAGSEVSEARWQGVSRRTRCEEAKGRCQPQEIHREGLSGAGAGSGEGSREKKAGCF